MIAISRLQKENLAFILPRRRREDKEGVDKASRFVGLALNPGKRCFPGRGLAGAVMRSPAIMVLLGRTDDIAEP
jgi:hypothetical protein